MLIEFSVQNHRAFRDKQTFTMAASATTQGSGHGHVLDTGLPIMPFVLTEACVFGANGSGKTSLINAMGAMKQLVQTSGRNSPSDRLSVKQFAFDAKSREEPSEFEVIFLIDDIVYQYGFSLTVERFIDEWLFARPKSTGRERRIFSREFNSSTGNHEWYINPNHLKGERDSWKSQTLENALFLSTAVRLNAEYLAPVFDWITKSWQLIDSADLQFYTGKTTIWIRDAERKNRVLEFLANADIGLSDVTVEDKDLPAEVISVIQAIIDSSESKGAMNVNDMKMPDITTFRCDAQGALRALAFSEESSGTRALFGLSAAMLDVLDKGQTLVVDELNTGLHPLAFQHLVGLFASRKTNSKGAQLIFTTHDTSVADQECLGRDQIWIVEKDKDLSARLVPLSAFKERGAKGFQKKYLDGRFGGIPKLVG